MAYHLIVSSDYNLWPQKEKILCLGEWCIPDNEKYIWSQFNTRFAEPFLPKDFEEFSLKAKKARDFEDELLEVLVPALNLLNDCKMTKRQWKIIFGN